MLKFKRMFDVIELNGTAMIGTASGATCGGHGECFELNGYDE